MALNVLSFFRLITEKYCIGIALANRVSTPTRERLVMWNWFNCYLSGRHEYGIWCEPGAIFLRCVHCGRRSPGWEVEGKGAGPAAPKARIETKAPKAVAAAGGTRVIPFNRTATS